MFLRFEQVLFDESVEVALAISQHVVPKPTRAPRVGHVGFKVLVRKPVWCSGRNWPLPCLIVAHVRLDSRSDYACERGTEKPAYASRKLERPRGSFPAFAL